MKTRKRKTHQKVRRYRAIRHEVDIGAFEDDANGWMAAAPADRK
jgi:hypothetical protein